MDTNGRRNDVIDALRGYLAILDDILRKQKLTWDALPKSTAELKFYRQALALSPDVFQKHDKYDMLMAQLDGMPELKKAIAEDDTRWLVKHYSQYPAEWRKELDKSVEARARHYTSTLFKLGFTDENRQITPVGDMLLGNARLYRDKIEYSLPLHDTNIIYLRQLLKLRIFDGDGKRYYSPFCMALYALLRKERISQDAFCAIVQGLSPYHYIADYGAFLDGEWKNSVMQGDSFLLPEEIDSFCEITEPAFMRLFKNGKSKDTVKIYYKFYQALAAFLLTESGANLNQLLTLYENHRDALNKAFGCGSVLFQNRRGKRPAAKDFLKTETLDLLKESDFRSVGLRNLNLALYRRFQQSKMMDGIREYADTTMRIFKATGLISFENGYAELAYRDLCQYVFDAAAVQSCIMGDMSTETDYARFHLYPILSLSRILGYSNQRINWIIETLEGKFGVLFTSIPLVVQRGRMRDFERMIARRYPKDRVQYLLGLFSDRSNDPLIKPGRRSPHDL